MELLTILKAAYEAGASDVHLIAGQVPVMRVHQVMTPMEFPVLAPDAVRKFFEHMASKEAVATFDRQKDSDFSFQAEGLARYRVNAHMQRGMIGMADAACAIVAGAVRPNASSLGSGGGSLAASGVSMSSKGGRSPLSISPTPKVSSSSRTKSSSEPRLQAGSGLVMLLKPYWTALLMVTRSSALRVACVCSPSR